MPDASIKAYFGGDVSGLKASIGEANRLVDSFAKGAKKAGLDIGKGFGFGILINQLRVFGTEAVEQAQKAREEFEKLGKPIDNATRTLAEFGDGLKDLKQFGVDAVGFLIGGFTQLGDLIGSGINRLRGISEAEENVIATIGRQTEKTLADIAAARAKFEAENTPEKRAAREKKALEDQEKAWSEYLRDVGKKQEHAAKKEKERILEQKRLNKELADSFLDAVDRNEAANRRLFEQKLDSIPLEERLIELERERGELIEVQKTFAKGTTDFKEVQIGINDTNKRIEQTRLEIAEKTAKAEKGITEEKKAQTAIGIAGIKTGAQLNDVSDETLQEISRRNRARAQQLRNPAGFGIGSGLAESIEAARLEQEAINAEKELNFRKKFLQDLQVGGVSLARQTFKGDPTSFDRVLQQLTSGLSKDDEVIKLLEKTNNLLSGKFRNQ